MGPACAVGAFEPGLLDVVPGTLGVGKMHGAFVLEWLSIHIGATTPWAWRACTILLVTQLWDLASHGATQILPIPLLAFVFGRHSNRSLEVTEAFVRVEVSRHG
jgi:hypothetical protein